MNALGNKTNAGRKKGIPNKTTSELKQTINLLVSNNIDEAQDWLTKVGKVNPAKALELLIRLTELVLPKPVAEVDSSSDKRDDYYKRQADMYIKQAKAS